MKNPYELRQRYHAGERNFSGVELNDAYFSDEYWLDINLNSACCQGISLKSSFVTHANLREIDFQEAYLWNSYFINANFRDANLRKAKLNNADLTGADLTGADLTGADLTNTKLIGTNLTNANLTDIITSSQLGSSVYTTVFGHTTMPDGSIRSGNRAIGVQEFLRRYAEGEKDFSNIILHHADLRGIELRKINFRYAHFSYIDLSKAKLIDSILSRATFIHCNLKNANFEHFEGNDDPYDSLGCNFNDARFLYTDMRESQISGETSSTVFIECNFEGAEMRCWGEDFAIYYNTVLKNGEFFSGLSNSYI